MRFGSELLSDGIVLLSLLALRRTLGDATPTRSLGASAALFVVGGLVLSAGQAATAGAFLLQAAIAGAVIVLLERTVLRHDIRLAVPIAAVGCVLEAVLLAARRPYVDATIGAVLGVIVVVALAAWWWRELHAGAAVSRRYATAAGNGDLQLGRRRQLLRPDSRR
jgi:hypothetical protein